MGFDPCVLKIPYRRAWKSTPVFLPEESHGQRSLAGYSPWGGKESEMTEWLHFQEFLITALLSKLTICSSRKPQFDSWVGKIHWRRDRLLTPAFLGFPGGSAGKEVKWSESHSVLSSSLQPHRLWPVRLLCPWDFPGKNTGVGYRFLLQGIFQTQGSNLVLLRCRQTLYSLSYWGNLSS